LIGKLNSVNPGAAAVVRLRLQVACVGSGGHVFLVHHQRIRESLVEEPGLQQAERSEIVLIEKIEVVGMLRDKSGIANAFLRDGS